MACLSNQIEVNFEVDSRYSIVETIGNGAYGVVCSAVDNKTGCKVAIKKISRAFDVPAITKRTLRELKILKHFKHDNVIGIKEILRPPENLSLFNDVYVVFDLMESDLHHIIHSKQSLSNEHIEYFLYQILRGLKYIHSANIIHRDLKPSNILVNHDCELKIGDFGMARSLLSSPNEQRRVMTEYVATRWYRAPELMLSIHQFSYGIDIWSVGCIFAEMLGRNPIFPGSNYLNQLQLILSVVGLPSAKFLAEVASERVRNYIGKLPQKEAVPFQKLFPDASAEAIDLLSLMLKLDPRERCTTDTALEHAYVSRYHDLDDEPSCRPLNCDFENVPLEKETLKSEIVKEIARYHSKHPRPKLTPLATKYFTKTVNVDEVVGSVNGSLTFADGSSTNQSVVSTVQPAPKKVEPRKRRQKGARRDSRTKKLKEDESKKQEGDSGLSVEDKMMLERWEKMQKTTKPFIHPIRKHMKDSIDVQSQEPSDMQVDNFDMQTPDALQKSQFQFTNLVPGQKDGVMTLVRDGADKSVGLKPQKATAVSADKHVVTSNKIPISQYAPVPHSQAEANARRKSTQSQDSTILVPMGTIPCYQIKGPFNPKGQVIIVPNIKPTSISNQNQRPVAIAPNILGRPITIPAIPQIQMPQDSTQNVLPIAAIPAVANIPPTTATIVTKVVESSGASTPIGGVSGPAVHGHPQGIIRTNSQLLLTSSVVGDHTKTAKLTSVNDSPIEARTSLPKQTVTTEKLSKSILKEQKNNVLIEGTRNESPQPVGTRVVGNPSSSTSAVCVVTPDGKVKAISPSDMLTASGSPLGSNAPSDWLTKGSGALPSNVETSLTSGTSKKGMDAENGKPVEGDPSKALTEKVRLDAELRKLDPQERNIVDIVRQLETENEVRGINATTSLNSKNEQLVRPDSIAISTDSTTVPQGDPSVYRSPDLEIPTISFSMISDVYDEDERGDGNAIEFDNKASRDVLLTTLLTPKTPKSGAYGYGLGLDLEELFNQTNPQEFWSGTRDITCDQQATNESAPLSSSLLNDWLGIKNLDTEAMEELQKELETNTSFLLFDS